MTVPAVPAPDRDAVRRVRDETTAVFRKYLHLPDAGALDVVHATYVANQATNLEPLWLYLIGGPSSGKTEPTNGLHGIDDVRVVGAITSDAALLSGVPKKKTEQDATGGVLREIGPRGTLVFKDFTSIISMHMDARAKLLAALREIYDGKWVRNIGSDGGRTMTWQGKLGVIACVTGAIDSAHGVQSSMGERFLSYRLPSSIAEAEAQADKALSRTAPTDEMRADMAEATRRLIGHADYTVLERELTRDELVWLRSMASVVVRARSAVDRDRRTREVIDVPEPEEPSRIALQMKALLLGLEAIGVDREQARQLVLKVAFDSLPRIRAKVLAYLFDRGTSMATVSVAEALGLPTSTVSRALQDLQVHKVLSGRKASDQQNAPWVWDVDGWAAERLEIATGRRYRPTPDEDPETRDEQDRILAELDFDEVAP